MPDIAVVVVAYRSAATLEACLTSILVDRNTRVIVVDNAADPHTKAVCSAAAKANAGRLHYHDPGLNLGYAKACNRGLAALAPSDLVAVVNPDVALERSLSELAAVAEFGPADAIAGRLPSQRSPRSVNARPAVSMIREFMKALVGSRAYRLPALAALDGRVHEVAQLDGALLLLTAPTWQGLGGFDERFELYYEDVDLCARIRRSGRCLLVNVPWGSHLGGHSFKASDGLAFVALRVSRTRYALKWWHPEASARVVALLIAVVEWLSRSIGRQPEGQATRSLALGRVLAELGEPGSQQVLIRTPGSGQDPGLNTIVLEHCLPTSPTEEN